MQIILQIGGMALYMCVGGSSSNVCIPWGRRDMVHAHMGFHLGTFPREGGKGEMKLILSQQQMQGIVWQGESGVEKLFSF